MMIGGSNSLETTILINGVGTESSAGKLETRYLSVWTDKTMAISTGVQTNFMLMKCGALMTSA